MFLDFSIFPSWPFLPWFIYNPYCPYNPWDARQTYCSRVLDDPDYVTVKDEYETSYDDDDSDFLPCVFIGSSEDEIQTGWQSDV